MWEEESPRVVNFWVIDFDSFHLWFGNNELLLSFLLFREAKANKVYCRKFENECSNTTLTSTLIGCQRPIERVDWQLPEIIRRKVGIASNISLLQKVLQSSTTPNPIRLACHVRDQLITLKSSEKSWLFYYLLFIITIRKLQYTFSFKKYFLHFFVLHFLHLFKK